MIQDLRYRLHRPGLAVIRAVHQSVNAGVHQRSGTHGARLNCGKQFTVFQTVVTDVGTGFAQGDYLGVGSGIGIRDIAVPAAANDSTPAHDDRPYGYFSRFEGALGAAQSFLHPELVWMMFTWMKFVPMRFVEMSLLRMWCVRIKSIRKSIRTMSGGLEPGIFGRNHRGCFLSGHARSLLRWIF
jgi:hypothetical protein